MIEGKKDQDRLLLVLGRDRGFLATIESFWFYVATGIPVSQHGS